MSLIASVYRQFHQPTGIPGRVVGWIMANRPSNIERSRWTVDLLSLQPTDHVLEIGFGPGLAIQLVARLVPRGRVVDIDHSALMVRQARRRNRAAIETGLVDLRVGGLDLLPRLGATFDTVFSVNVLQFLRDRSEALLRIRAVLKPHGLFATTVQPRQRGAIAADAHAFGHDLSKELIQAHFREVTVKKLDLKPVPAICVLARN
jgi:SAM-dependent methyltransferase